MGPAGTVLTPLRGYALDSPIEPDGWRRGLQSDAPPGLRSRGKSAGCSAPEDRGEGTLSGRDAAGKDVMRYVRRMLIRFTVKNPLRQASRSEW